MQPNEPTSSPDQESSALQSINTSQVPETPTQQQTVANKKMTKWLVIVLITLLIGVTTVFAYKYYQLKGQVNKRLSESATTQPSPQIKQATPTVVEFDKTPQINSLYLGKYLDKEALFVTNPRLSKHYEGDIEKTTATVGVLEQIDGPSRQPFDYTSLENPRKILVLDLSEDLLGIGNFTFDSEKNTLYVVLGFVGPSSSYPNITQRVYQINLSSLERKQIWIHKIGDDKYPKKGPAVIDKVADNKYLVLWLGTCYACEDFDPHGSVLLNIESGEEKYLGEVNNFEFNLPNNTVSYQKLTSFEEACEPSPGCSNGKRTVYRPSGEIFTATLP